MSEFQPTLKNVEEGIRASRVDEAQEAMTFQSRLKEPEGTFQEESRGWR